MIFISYAREDEAYANMLASLLEERHQKYWIDRERIPIGNNWRIEIEIAIKQASSVVVIMSHAAADPRSFVREELGYARSLQKPILPLIIEEIPPESFPLEIANLNQIRCVGDFEYCINELLRSLVPQEEGSCDVRDRRNLLEEADRILVSHFSKAHRITVKKEVTKGNSGSKVYYVDAAFRSTNAPDSPHFLKIHHSQGSQPRERHEKALKTKISAFMPNLADATPWDPDTKRIALLYGLRATTGFDKSLDELLGKDLKEAVEVIQQTCDSLLEWNKPDRMQTLSMPALLRTALTHSEDPLSRKRRLENPETSVESRIRTLLGVDSKAPRVDFEHRSGLPNPLAYLMNLDTWQSESGEYIDEIDISYPSGHIHGDMNVRNILALKERNGRRSFSLIDFDTYDPDNLIFIDFAYLEIAVILRLCSPEVVENQEELERLSEYLVSQNGTGIELPEGVPPLNVVSVGTIAVLRVLRKAVGQICDRYSREYPLAFWIARIAAGLEMARKTRPTQQERILAFLIATDSLNRLIREAGLKIPTGNAYQLNWANSSRE